MPFGLDFCLMSLFLFALRHASLEGHITKVSLSPVHSSIHCDLIFYKLFLPILSVAATTTTFLSIELLEWTHI